MEALEIYFTQEHNDGTPIIVHTEAELDAALDEFAAHAPDARILAQIVWKDDPWRAIFEIGVYGDLGVISYSGDSAPKGVLSQGGPAQGPEDSEIWYFVRADTEVSRNAEVPFTAVRAAAHEFLRTGGEQPTSVGWQPRFRG